MKMKYDKNKKIGVAVSGGVDSMVMLDLFRRDGANIVAINIEHGIRGEESVNDSNFVKEYCKRMGVELRSYAVNSLDYAEKKGVSIELAARKLRYEIFDSLLKEKVVDVIALAHHLGDQVETILMRLFRGTGVRGMRGIVDRPGFIHPMLPFRKHQIKDYALLNCIPYVEDSTNNDKAYTRNFIRKEIVPTIKARFGALEHAIEKISTSMTEVEDYLMSEITPATIENGIASLPLSIFDRHPAIAKKSIVECLRQMGVDKDIERVHLENILSLKKRANNAKLNLPFDIDVRKEYDKLTFKRRGSQETYNEPFDVNEEYSFGGYNYSFVESDGIVKGLTFDADSIPPSARIRTRQSGDKFKRFAGGTKSLSDYLTDIRLPRSLRDTLLVVADGHEVYLVLGVEIGENAKVTENTKKILKINISEDI